MDLSNLRPSKGSSHSKMRLGRGVGSGKGGTSTKGHNGQISRSGYKEQFWYEGGQLPIHRRLPKYGFTNINRVEYQAINLDVLERLAEKQNVTTISFQTLIDGGITSKNSKVKILGDGELNKKLTVQAHAFSKSAKNTIESLGGTAEKI